METKDLKC